MGKFLVLRVLDSNSISIPHTKVYGQVEIRSNKSDSEDEIETLRRSAQENRKDFNHYAICARIATIVEAEDNAVATGYADSIFSEILDLKSVDFSVSNFKLSEIGFVKNLESGSISPITNTDFEPSMAFVVSQGSIQQIDFVNHILSLDNELSKRYQRSLHWVRNSKHEKNAQLKTLFYCFAVEALIKETENDNIGGSVRWFLGFPNGKNRSDVSVTTLLKLREHPSYDFWNKELIEIFEKIRVFRNDSVHAGFRSTDFTKNELNLYSQIMLFGASRCQSAVRFALIAGIKNVSEFKEYIPIIFEENCNIINDIHGNIIYSLDQLKHS